MINIFLNMMNVTQLKYSIEIQFFLDWYIEDTCTYYNLLLLFVLVRMWSITEIMRQGEEKE